MKHRQNIDIINLLEDARIDYDDMRKKIILSGYQLPSKPSSDGIYRTFIYGEEFKNGRKMITASTLERLKDKVYDYERSKKTTHYACVKTIKDVFDITQAEKLKYIKSEEKLYSVKNTIARKQRDYNRFIAKTNFEKLLIVEVTKQHIEEFLLETLRKHDLTKKAFENLKGLLKPIFDLAFQEYWIEDNPYARIDFKKFTYMFVEAPNIEDRYHNNEEIKKMLAYIHEKQEMNPTFVTPFALELQLLTGMRRGEIPPLRWDDITDCILIHREMILLDYEDKNKTSSSVIVEHTKTNKNRKFPVTKEIQDLLDRLKNVHRLNGWDSEFLFPAKNENGCISARTSYEFYRKMCKTLDIKISKDLIKGPHSFRRSRETEVINKSGGNIILAAGLFGHSTQVAKKHYYTGLDMDEARKILESK